MHSVKVDVDVRALPMQRGRLSPEQDFRALVSSGLLCAGDLLLHESDTGAVQHATLLCDGAVALADGTVHALGVAALSAMVEGRNGWKGWRHEPTGRTLADLHIEARSRQG